MAEVWFSLDGERFQRIPVRVALPSDRSRESSRNVTVSLRSRSARFVRIRLFFADKWILLSEVSFESGRVPSDEAC